MYYNMATEKVYKSKFFISIFSLHNILASIQMCNNMFAVERL